MGSPNALNVRKRRWFLSSADTEGGTRTGLKLPEAVDHCFGVCTDWGVAMWWWWWRWWCRWLLYFKFSGSENKAICIGIIMVYNRLCRSVITATLTSLLRRACWMLVRLTWWLVCIALCRVWCWRMRGHVILCCLKFNNASGAIIHKYRSTSICR